MSINTGGPAFPSHGSMGEVAHQGMTLRDYFAGQALAGVNADPSSREDSVRSIAESAYVLADAMLAAREAKQ